MRPLIVFLALCAAGFGAVAAHAEQASPLPAFHAEYEVLRNGKMIGKATVDLKHLSGDEWDFSTQTHGTHGMASMLGLDLRESSQFTWRDGLPQGRTYRFMQKITMSNKERQIDFDWNRQIAKADDGKKIDEIPLTPGAMDRNLTIIAVGADLKRGKEELIYPVADKDKLENRDFNRNGEETLDLPAGSIPTVRVDRISGKKRLSTWYAPQQDYLPVQIEQENKGDTVTMRLLSLKRGACCQ